MAYEKIVSVAQSATSGQVPTANGAGGFAWQTPQGGSVTSSMSTSLWAMLHKTTYVTPLTPQEISNFKTAWGIPEHILTAITATYNGGTVAAGTSLDALKNDLVIIAAYLDGISEIVTDYTLSGSITEGSSTITASYNSKTTTFNVNGKMNLRYTSSYPNGSTGVDSADIDNPVQYVTSNVSTIRGGTLIIEYDETTLNSFNLNIYAYDSNNVYKGYNKNNYVGMESNAFPLNITLGADAFSTSTSGFSTVKHSGTHIQLPTGYAIKVCLRKGSNSTGTITSNGDAARFFKENVTIRIV